jgi:hypothetical protein
MAKLDRQAERLLSKVNRLARKIEKTRARTFVGLMKKAYVAAREAEMWHGDEDVSTSIVRDLMKLGDVYMHPEWQLPRGRRA